MNRDWATTTRRNRANAVNSKHLPYCRKDDFDFRNLASEAAKPAQGDVELHPAPSSGAREGGGGLYRVPYSTAAGCPLGVLSGDATSMLATTVTCYTMSLIDPSETLQVYLGSSCVV